MGQLSKLYPLTTHCAGYLEGFEIIQISEIPKFLEEDHVYCYHTEPNRNYIVYGDVDSKEGKETIEWNAFEFIFTSFLKDEYGIELKEPISYTKNSKKDGSFHFSIPELYCKATTLKKLVTKFYSKYTEFDDGKDVVIYTNHWWRLPNQTYRKRPYPHVIIRGKMKDFVVDLIPENSRNIEELVEEEEETQIVIEEAPSEERNVLKRLFDECYKQSRFEDYGDWLKIAMGLKHTFGEEGYDLFCYASHKCPSKFDLDKNKKIWDGINFCEKPITIRTLYMFAVEDNRQVFLEILHSHRLFGEIEMTHMGISARLKAMFQNRFIWSNKKLRCFNGHYWEAR